MPVQTLIKPSNHSPVTTDFGQNCVTDKMRYSTAKGFSVDGSEVSTPIKHLPTNDNVHHVSCMRRSWTPSGSEPDSSRGETSDLIDGVDEGVGIEARIDGGVWIRVGEGWWGEANNIACFSDGESGGCNAPAKRKHFIAAPLRTCDYREATRLPQASGLRAKPRGTIKQTRHSRHLPSTNHCGASFPSNAMSFHESQIIALTVGPLKVSGSIWQHQVHRRPGSTTRRRFSVITVIQDETCDSSSGYAMLNVSSTARSLETVQVAQGQGIGEGFGHGLCRDPSQYSPGVISENHGKPKSGWPDRESNPGPPECESSELPQRQLARAGETGYPRENPLTSGIVRHDSHMRKFESDPAGDQTLRIWNHRSFSQSLMNLYFIQITRLPPRHVGIVPDNAADRRVFSVISCFPRTSIPVLLHTHLASHSSAFKTSMLRAAQISSLTQALHSRLSLVALIACRSAAFSLLSVMVVQPSKLETVGSEAWHVLSSLAYTI
ncbi:hypothetical protein PR048_017669 [Dryococelus australis]|uniref:Uncharacterized protein n=1 Tax=Dryococelus australis TaxID=614101 RepID=A0ABQ9HAF1_9NEOP|nr:hypothetical protein PR048_017669 [Dryococelus australis]